MKKMTTLSLTVLSLLSCASADTIEEALKGGEAGGQIRLGYIMQNNTAGAPDTRGAAIGGQVRYETGSWNGASLGIAGYVSQNIQPLSGSGDKQNPDFFGSDGDSFAYVGEAYVQYVRDTLSVRLGRQQIDTPLADTDDIRMLPNTFEALIGTYTGIDKLTLAGGYVTRWAGFDSGDDISGFKRLGGPDSRGTAVAGAIYEGVENLSLQGWFYGIDEVADALYADAAYVIALGEKMGLEIGVQSAYFDESSDSGVDGAVVGGSAAFDFKALTFSAAVNAARNDSGKAVSIGFGGGPYLTSMEEMTIDGLNDAEAFTLGIEADASEWGVNGLFAAMAYGHFESNADEEAQELDMIVSYKLSEALDGELSYARIDDRNGNLGGDWDRMLLRVNYNF